MNRSGHAVLAAVLTGLIGLGSSALAQAPQPTGPATAQAPAPGPGQRPPAAAPAQPPRPSAAPAQPRPGAAPGEVRRPGYRACLRAAKRRGLRGSVRRAFITRCRLGREPLSR